VNFPDHRRRILDRWDRSGLSAAAFAPSVGVTPWTLYAWRRRERKLAGKP
jgi:transposase-like protein